jgi:hypothetical protein
MLLVVSPTANLNTPLLVHIALLTGADAKPVIVAEIELEGLKIPMLYRITATMTMINMAQP